MVELGCFLPGLVEVGGAGSCAGVEVEGLAGLAGHLVGVGARTPFAPVAALDVSSAGVGRRPDAGGVGVAQGHIGAGGR